jgi:hypothetical protein
MSELDLYRLAGLAYHEARHMEQYYRGIQSDRQDKKSNFANFVKADSTFANTALTSELPAHLVEEMQNLIIMIVYLRSHNHYVMTRQC